MGPTPGLSGSSERSSRCALSCARNCAAPLGERIHGRDAATGHTGDLESAIRATTQPNLLVHPVRQGFQHSKNVSLTCGAKLLSPTHLLSTSGYRSIR